MGLFANRENSLPTHRATKRELLAWVSQLLSFLLLGSALSVGQGELKDRTQLKPKKTAAETPTVNPAELEKTQRREFAASLVISLANEARSYSNLALRPRVLARAEDILWDADKTSAWDLFHRAWEAAEKGDAEQATIRTKDGPPPMVIALRRASGHDPRSEVR